MESVIYNAHSILRVNDTVSLKSMLDCHDRQILFVKDDKSSLIPQVQDQ